MKKLANNILVSIILTAITLLFGSSFSVVRGAVMSSTNYSVQSDSVNFGGVGSDSASYAVEDTLGEVATGDSSSTNYNLHAGYQQMQEVYLAMTTANDVTMSPSLGGLTGGTSNGSTTTTVTTDSPAGYELYLKASSSPAMQGNTQGDSIANYTPTTSDPDFAFSVTTTDAEFGFTPEGTDIASKYKDDGASCNAGSNDTVDACWNAVLTSNELVSRRTSANHTAGTATVIKFRLTIGSSSFKAEDTYTATTTLTALAL